MRLKYIDVLKGIGILLVLMAHSYGFLVGASYFTSSFMQLFFVASGMVYRPGGALLESIKKRFGRLIVPYFLYNVFLIMIAVVDGRLSSLSQILEAAFGSLYSTYCLYATKPLDNNYCFYLVYNEPMWFLTAMFCTSVLFLSIVDFFERQKQIKQVLILGGLLIISKLLCLLPIYLPWGADKAALGCFLMLVGRLLVKLQDLYKGWKWKELLVYALCLATYIGLCKINPNINMSLREYGDIPAGNVICFAMIGILGSILWLRVCVLVEKWKIGNALAYIGKNSIIILALHLVLFRKLQKVFEWGVKFSANRLWYWVCAWTMILFVAMVCLIAGKMFQCFKSKIMNKYGGI